MFDQSFLPVFPLSKVVIIQEGTVTQSLRQLATINTIDPHHDNRRVTHLCTSVQRHLQFSAAKLTGHVIVRHDSQNFATGVHALRHVVNHRLTNLKVPVVYAVVQLVLLYQRNEI